MESHAEQPRFIYEVRTITQERREKPEIRTKLTNAIASTTQGKQPVFPDVFERAMLGLRPLVERNGPKHVPPPKLTGGICLDVVCTENEVQIVALPGWCTATPLARATISLSDFTITCEDPAPDTAPTKEAPVEDNDDTEDARATLLLYLALTRSIEYMPSLSPLQRISPLLLPRRGGYLPVLCATPQIDPTKHLFWDLLAPRDPMIMHAQLSRVSYKLVERVLSRKPGENAPKPVEKTHEACPSAEHANPLAEKVAQLEARVAALEKLNRDRYESMLEAHRQYDAEKRAKEAKANGQ